MSRVSQSLTASESDSSFDASYWRTLNTLHEGKDFVDAFYERFFATSQEVRDHFAATDLEQQKRKLRLSLLFMASYADGREPSPALQKIAESHGPIGYGIAPQLFDVWLESLLETLRAYDPEYGPEIERCWRSTMQPGVDYMKARCGG